MKEKTEFHHDRSAHPWPDKPITLTRSGHGMTAIEIQNVSQELQKLVRGILKNQFSDSEDYKVRQNCGAFLQGDAHDWILIEFWSGTPEDHQAFADYLNRKIEEEKSKG